MLTDRNLKRFPTKLVMVVLICIFAFALIFGAEWLNLANLHKQDQEAKKAGPRVNIVLFSYQERPIFDIRLNGEWIGAAGAFPSDVRETVADFPITPGLQIVSWRLDSEQGTPGMPDDGKTLRAANQPILEHIDPKMPYMGLHIYPDNTVELLFSEEMPDYSPKGIQLNQAFKDKAEQALENKDSGGDANKTP